MIWMMLLGALPIDPVGDPLPRYLTPNRIKRELEKLTEPLQGCIATGDLTEPLAFSIHGNGRAQQIVWGEGRDEVHQCWSVQLEQHRFSPHDDTPIRVETTLYVRNGVVTLSPQPTVHARTLGPLMLFVLPENIGRVSGYLHGASESKDDR